MGDRHHVKKLIYRNRQLSMADLAAYEAAHAGT
jgi:hypothetical protein